MPDAVVPPPERPDLYVVARFLDRLCQPDAVYTHSRLQAAVGVNYDLYRAYLSLLESKGFLVRRFEKEEKEVVRITPAGLEARRELCGWIARVLGERHLVGRARKGAGARGAPV